MTTTPTALGAFIARIADAMGTPDAHRVGETVCHLLKQRGGVAVASMLPHALLRHELR